MLGPDSWPVSENDIFMPGMPAPPRNSAHSDQPKAAKHADADEGVHGGRAMAGIEPGGAVERPGPPTTTGAASVREAHCQ